MHKNKHNSQTNYCSIQKVLKLLTVKIRHAVNKDASVVRDHQPYGMGEKLYMLAMRNKYFKYCDQAKYLNPGAKQNI